MPKETIVGERGVVFGPDSLAIQIAQVRWSRSEFVELALRIVDPTDHEDYSPTEAEWPGSGGEAIRGTYMPLERHQINELIRHLRRARDQAFGRDE